MGIKLTKLPDLSPENLTESKCHLWRLLREREECILQLKDEIARLKGYRVHTSRLEVLSKSQTSYSQRTLAILAQLSIIRDY